MRNVELKELQDLVYGIFVEFDRVCRKYNIKYTMEGGTLLGAVKYQNFVPWDDDIDVVMVREEYNKFLQVAPQELGEKYFLQTYHTSSQFPLNYAKLCLNGTEIFDYDYSHLKGMHHGIFMDIFPLDYVEMETLRKHCSHVGALTGARKTKLKIKFGKARWWKKIIYKFLSLLPMKTLNKAVDNACTKHNKKGTQWRYEVCNSNRKFKPLPASLYDEVIEIPFRDGKFYAVKGYDEFLKSRFGENYMNELPPEEKRNPSHCQNIRIEE